ncbi:hypothetical protein [Ensifer adhaerens]|uniref:hypothetical protein n=1 Tax=Ensifer adhaerens TaxID=106592 RepID=UPI001C4E1A9E|nr:hypothetical protein [Ensifer adhaerens]MBW0366647.1 hypothetical protein [Ensifer adhaerens]UCM18408.1 hypothetical protein LDL63_11110 [Ensifer adhaerens]
MPVAPHPYKTEKARELEFDFKEFADCRLIYSNAYEIREAFLKQKKTIKKPLGNLRTVQRFITLYENKHKTQITSSSDITVIFCVEFVVYCLNRFGSTAAGKIRFCWRLLKTVGVPTDVIPPNPVSDPAPKLRGELGEKSARNFLNSAKKEARVVIDRYHQAEEMNSQGRDPRRVAASKKGLWDQLENRLWICRELLGIRANSERDLIALGHRGIIRSMEERPGAVVIDPQLGPVQQTGLLAHLRFYHPSLADLAPFIGLLMIRSDVNLQCVADCPAASSKWSEPYARAFSHGEEPDRWVSIILPKLRGAQGSKRKRRDEIKGGRVAKSPARISFPSLKKPWSHPFQVLSFVQKLTQPLRAEVNRRIEEISSKSDISDNEKWELDRLQSIKDDMFLYRNRNSITSLKLVTRDSQVTPPALVDVFERYGLTDGVRQLRDTGLHFGFRTSGHSLLILHLLARHSSRETASAYARRRDFFRRSEELFVAIFDKSVALVRSSNYTIANLREELRASGLEDWQITNVLDPNTRTRYGNRCGGPTSPPKPFDNGTPPGQLCRGQDCIDGCPLARFLPDALPFLVKQWSSIKQQLASVGIAAAFENSLQHRLNKLERILNKYPLAAVLAEKEKLKEEGGVDTW